MRKPAILGDNCARFYQIPCRGTTMKAAVLHGARDIRIESYRQPEVRPGMVLLRTRRVGLCGTDLHYYEHGHNAAFVPDRPFILATNSVLK